MATLVSQIRTFTVELKYVYFKHKEIVVSHKNVQINIKNLIVSCLNSKCGKTTLQYKVE